MKVIRPNRTPILFLLVALIGYSCSPPPEEAHSEYSWFEFSIPDLDTIATDVDMSFLNPDPAGEAGRVTVKNGHFFDGKGDPIRFFGTNLTFSSAFPDKATSQKIAARLRKMGYNVMRFHHLDMRKSPDGIWDDGMEEFDPQQLDRLDWLIYQLKMKGIYSNLNLHVSRNYPGLEELEYDGRHFRFGKSVDHFYRPYIEMQKEYARNLLTHKNPYTGNTYVEEPAVAFVEINNENSLLSNWRHINKFKGPHQKSLADQWVEWLVKEGIDVDRDVYWMSQNYDSLASEKQKEVFWQFLLDIEMSYAHEMSQYLTEDLEVKAPISVTQASYSGIAGIVREAEYADFIDLHAYWEHPRFPGTAWSRTEWLIRNSSMVADKRVGTLARFGMHNVQGMPLTISEYDHPAPTFFCAEMYPMLNSMAAYQNWDGIYHFTFNGPWEEGFTRGFFSSSGHPLKQIFLPVGAALFRMGAVSPGNEVVKLQLPKEAVIPELVRTGSRLRLHGSNMDQVWKAVGAPVALPVLRPIEVVVGGEELSLSESVAEPDGPWVSQTGELVWDNQDSINATYTINAAAAKGAVGYVGGKSFDLGDVTISIDTTEFNWASIVMVALDRKDISRSSKVLLVAAGRVENSEMGWNDDRTTVGAEWGKAPVLAEGIPANLSFRDMDHFKAYSLDPAGNKKEAIKSTGSDEEQLLQIGAQYKTLWYLLER